MRVVSASENTPQMLERASLSYLVDAVVDGEAIRRHHLRVKPAPDTLLAACRELGVEPERAAAFETTRAGVLAAHEAGFHLVVGVDGATGADTGDSLRAEVRTWSSARSASSSTTRPLFPRGGAPEPRPDALVPAAARYFARFDARQIAESVAPQSDDRSCGEPTPKEAAMNALTPTPTDREQETAPQLFTRVLVGIDGSPESIEAARQAALLAAPDGKTTLLAAWTVPPPTVGGISGQSYSHELDAGYYRRRTEDTLAKAKSALQPPAETEARAVRGVAWRTLIEQAAAEKATVLVVGSHGQGRIKGILLGSTATEVVHKAPCSVLVAREAGELFPRRVVVGVDGSPESAAAYAAARAIAARFESELWPVVAAAARPWTGRRSSRSSAITTTRPRTTRCRRCSRHRPTPTWSSSAAAGCTASRPSARSRSASLTRRTARR